MKDKNRKQFRYHTRPLLIDFSKAVKSHTEDLERGARFKIVIAKNIASL